MDEKYSLGIKSILQNGFWFIDIPRTSSSSIRVELGKQFGDVYGKLNLIDKSYSTNQIFPDHMTAMEMRNLIGIQNWKKLFTFSIVRNPWDRTFSIFNYRKIKGNIPSEWNFFTYVNELKEATPESEYFSYHGFRFGAIEYLVNDKGEIIVDYILKYENRDEDLKKLSKMLGFNISGKTYIQAASPKGQHYSNFYNSETKSIIESIYSKDIELFNYQFENI